jgi:hypothetical protein
VPQVFIDGQLTTVKVDHVGQLFNVWRLERQPFSYEVFCNQKGGVSVSLTEKDADELEAELLALKEGSLSSQAFEDHLIQKIYPFLQTVQSEK